MLRLQKFTVHCVIVKPLNTEAFKACARRYTRPRYWINHNEPNCQHGINVNLTEQYDMDIVPKLT